MMQNKSNKNEDYLLWGVRNVGNVITVMTVTLAILIFGVWFMVSPKREFSESENRQLALWPTYTFQSLKDGSYMSSIQKYLSDHFPARDQFMTLKTKAEIMMGKQEINNIYLAKDGYLIEAYDEP